MESILQHSLYQSFGTDCKNLISMIKKPHTWPSFATKLEVDDKGTSCMTKFCNRTGGGKDVADLFSGFQDLASQKCKMKLADSLARTTRSLYIESCVMLVILFRFDYQTTSSLINRITFVVEKNPKRNGTCQ